MSSKVVLDASALLCLLNDEPGAAQVLDVLTRSVVGTANLAEVVSKLRERGVPLDEVREALGGLHLDVRPLSPAQAMIVGDLRPRPSRSDCRSAIGPASPWRSTCRRRCLPPMPSWRTQTSASALRTSARSSAQVPPRHALPGHDRCGPDSMMPTIPLPTRGRGGQPKPTGQIGVKNLPDRSKHPSLGFDKSRYVLR